MKRLQVLKFAGQDIEHHSLDGRMLSNMKKDSPLVYATYNEDCYDIILWDKAQQCIRVIKRALPRDFFTIRISNPFVHGGDGDTDGVKLWEVQKETNVPMAQAFLILLLKNGYRGYQMTDEVYNQLKREEPHPKMTNRALIGVESVKDISEGFIPRKSHKTSAVLANICREVGLIKGLAFATLPTVLGAKFHNVIERVDNKGRTDDLKMSLNTESGKVDIDYTIKITSTQRQAVVTRKYSASIDPTSFKDAGSMVTDIYALSSSNMGYSWRTPSVINNSYSTGVVAINGQDVDVATYYKTYLENLASNILQGMKKHPSTLGVLHDKTASWRFRDESGLSDSWAQAVLYTFLLVNSISLIDNITTYLKGFPEEEARILEYITTEMFKEKLDTLKISHHDRGQSESVLEHLVTLENSDIAKCNLAILRPFKHLGVVPLGKSLECIQEENIVVQSYKGRSLYSATVSRRSRHAYNSVVHTLTNSTDYVELLTWFEDVIKNVPDTLSPIKKIGKAVARYVGGKNVLKELVNPNSVVAHITGFEGASRGYSVSDYVTNYLFKEGILKEVFSESMLQWWESEDVKPLFLGDTSLKLLLSNSATRNLLKLLCEAPFTDGQRKRVLIYLVQDAVSRQRVRDPKSDYADYLHAYAQLVERGFRSWDRFDLEPYSVRLAHDIYTAEYEELKEGLEREVFLSTYQGLRDMKLSEHIILDKYFLQLPDSEEDLKKEGDALSHCVGGYGSRIKRGECVILFLRSVDEPDTSFVTVELNKHQVYGELVYTLGHIEGDSGNRNPSLRIRNALKVVTDLVRKSQEQFNKTGEYIPLAPEKKKKKQEALAI